MHALDIDWDRPTDPRPGPQLDHVRAYVTTAGADGHLWHGVPTLLLTTVDRATGRTVRTPLIYGEDRDTARLIVLASAYGAADHPAWYENLAAHPEARVQLGATTFRATARTATPTERDTYWDMMTALWPPFEDDQVSAWPREIPLVILQR
ncbi:nitroreductase/quinone reductase family protein [Streptomyces sp. NPDC006463]|uniref:nitroreductase/quinone reductase family protein n=1 Tax=Streptomyces sp. NPDC006463 TaxID=3364746 RepID=UPI0036A65565